MPPSFVICTERAVLWLAMVGVYVTAVGRLWAARHDLCSHRNASHANMHPLALATPYT